MHTSPSKGRSPWKTLFIVPDGAEPTQIALGDDVRIQLRADATRFHLSVRNAQGEDGKAIAEVTLLGATPRSISESEITYEGFLDVSKSLFGNPDGTKTVRRTEIILTRD